MPIMTRSLRIRDRLWPLVCVMLMSMAGTAGLDALSDQETRNEREQKARAEQAADGSSRQDDAETDVADREGETDESPGKGTRTEEVVSATPQNVSPLVKAAASSTKTKSSRRFTNADLARAKGRIIVIEGTNVREPEIVPIEERRPEATNPVINEHEQRALGLRRQAAIKALRDEISTLDTEVRLLEDDYYNVEEEDNREIIEGQFAEKRRALAAAKEKLKELEGGGNE